MVGAVKGKGSLPVQVMKEVLTVKEEARVDKYRECIMELSTAAKMVIRGEKLVMLKALVPEVLEAAHNGKAM